MGKKINIGFIGIGRFGKIRYNIFRKNPCIGESYYFDKNVSSYQGMTSCSDLSQLLEKKDIQAILICVPNYLTKEMAIQAIQANKHVFCEKPPGMSFEEASEINKAVEINPEIKFKFGFNHRYMTHFKELKELIASEKYGKIRWVKGVYGKGYDETFLDAWRSKGKYAGGGIFLDQGIHLLDLISQLLGDLDVVHAMVDNLHWQDSDVEDNVMVHLRSKEKGIPVSFHSSAVHWKHTFKLEVITERAMLVIDGVKSSTRSYGDEQLTVHHRWENNYVETVNIKKNDLDYYTHVSECNEFSDAIIHNKPIEHGTTKEAMNLMKLVQDVYSFNKLEKDRV